LARGKLTLKLHHPTTPSFKHRKHYEGGNKTVDISNGEPWAEVLACFKELNEGISKDGWIFELENENDAIRRIGHEITFIALGWSPSNPHLKLTNRFHCQTPAKRQH